jgi:hypothetical protein
MGRRATYCEREGRGQETARSGATDLSTDLVPHILDPRELMTPSSHGSIGGWSSMGCDRGPCRQKHPRRLSLRGCGGRVKGERGMEALVSFDGDDVETRVEEGMEALVG